MGANVVAVSRSSTGLAKLKKSFPSIRIVQLTDYLDNDTAAIAKTFGKHMPDTFLDLFPPAPTGSYGVTACMLSLKPGGRIALMGARNDASIPLPWSTLSYRSLTIKGCFMYERDDVRRLIRLLESVPMLLLNTLCLEAQLLSFLEGLAV